MGENVIPDDLVYNPNNYAQDTYNYSGSPIINEAIVAWNSDSTYENVLSNTKKPSHFIIQIDAALNVSAMDGTQINGSLGDIASNIIKTQNAIPVVAIDSQEEADALTVCLNTNGLRDIMVLSSDASLLNTVLTNTSGVLGVWDLSAETKTYSADELGVITQNANSNHIRIILLNSKSADYESVRMLQKRTMTVWASVTNEDDVAVYRMLSNGVDGVVTNSYSDVHSAMNVFTGNNVLLQLPTLTAHRGYVYGADGSVFPEVSVDALKQAAEYGADAVELDVYSISDGVLVLHHDATTDRVMTSVMIFFITYCQLNDTSQLANLLNLILVPGDLYILAPGDVHNFLGSKEEYSHRDIMLSCRLWEVICENLHINLFDILLPYQQKIHLSLDGIRSLETSMSHFFDYRQKSPNPEENPYVYIVLTDIIKRFLFRYTQDESPSDPHILIWLTKLINQLSLPENITKDKREILSTLHYSQEHVCRVFKQHMHETITDYINNKRLDLAASMFCTTTKTVREICRECGFESTAYFSKLFQKRFGVVPSKFRSQSLE